MRPQSAPLGEPTRIVALVREGRFEQRRRGSLLEAPRPRSRRWSIPRDRPSSEHRGEARAFPHRLAVLSFVTPGRSPPFGSAGSRKTGRSAGSAAAAGFGPCLRRAHGAAAGFLPRPFAADWVRGIRAVHGGRTLASRPWTGGSAGGLGIDRQVPRRLAAVRRCGRWERPSWARLASTPWVRERVGLLGSARPSGANPERRATITRRSAVGVGVWGPGLFGLHLTAPVGILLPQQSAKVVRTLPGRRGGPGLRSDCPKPFDNGPADLPPRHRHRRGGCRDGRDSSAPVGSCAGWVRAVSARTWRSRSGRWAEASR